MIETVTSIAGVTIRLTDERWAHITEEHSELAGMRFEVLETIAVPERVYKGRNDELFAVREIETGKFMLAVYRETGLDGFIITAFLTRRMQLIEKRELVWSVQK